MREDKLRDYFENKLTPQDLTADLKDNQKRSSNDLTTVHIDVSEHGEFEVTKGHLIRLCEDVLAESIPLANLNTIGFALITSDYFAWDGFSQDGQIISGVISDWDNPEIGSDITFKNVQLWKEYLLTGIYRLDKNELKQKFRSKGKYKELYQSIDEILWNDWDPIGINDIAPRDEYQGYTPTILYLKIRGSDKEIIAKKLFDLETKSMGLSGNIDNCRIVASKIVHL